ncbi:MAG: B12-binding domain-containing radical SAM protein [Chitinispirillaceae bacterium]|nr:B12-binding domain-containing radical SAM protein [Chitinispirillaceae bacterium]
MKVAMVTPASDLHRTLLYRLGHVIYEPENSIPGPLILGKILADAGHTVDVYEELYRDLPMDKVLRADVIGLSTMTSTAPRAYALADYFRSRGKRVIIGGFHASVMPDEAKEHCDQVITGEAESVIKAVIEGASTDPVVRGEPIPDIDSIPFPDYSLIRSPVNTANFITSRGCPNSCSFCTTSRMFHPYREMSPEKVVEAIRHYRAQGFSRVNIQDDNFTANKARTKRICRMLIDNNLAFRETFFFGRVDVADDEELVDLLQRAGFRIILVGMESTNQKSLDSVDKKQSVGSVHESARRLTNLGMKLSASIILGLEYDTKEDIARTVDFCRSINAYSLQPPILTPYPGTRLFEELRKEGRILTEDWQYYDMMHVIFRPRNMTPLDLQKLFKWALRRFYSFSSVIRVLRTWGVAEAVKRLGMALAVRFGSIDLSAPERKYRSIISKN